MDLTDCEETTGIDDPSTPRSRYPSGPSVIRTIHVIQSESIRRIQMAMDLTDCEETTGIDDPSTPVDPNDIQADQCDPNDPCDPIGINTTDTDGDGLTDCEETTGIDDPSTPENPNDSRRPNMIQTIHVIQSESIQRIQMVMDLTDCEETTGIDDPSTPEIQQDQLDPNDPCDPIGINTTDTDGDGLNRL